MDRVVRSVRPKKYESKLISKDMADRYSFDELVSLVDEFRNYENPDWEIVMWDDYIESITFTGRRVETDEERTARLAEIRRQKQAVQAKKREAELEMKKKELEQLAYLKSKYPEEL